MAQTNYPEELTNLLEEYLTDGVISAKERVVLLNKADALGIDVNEFDLYIDAQQQKLDQAVEAAASKKRGKSCPYCGGLVPLLTDKCPHCGETITPEATDELKEIFEEIETALVELKAGNDVGKNQAIVERYARKARIYYGSNPRIQKLLEEVKSEQQMAQNKLFWEQQMAKKEAQAAARKETVSNILSNKWIWAGVITLIGIILIYVGANQKSETSFWNSGEPKDDPSYSKIIIGILLIGISFLIMKYRGKKS